MEKPIKPIEPNIKDYPAPKISNAVNSEGMPLFLRLDYHLAYKKYQIDKAKYDIDIEKYNQLKLIKLVKNATEKWILKNVKISRI